MSDSFKTRAGWQPYGCTVSTVRRSSTGSSKADPRVAAVRLHRVDSGKADGWRRRARPRSKPASSRADVEGEGRDMGSNLTVIGLVVADMTGSLAFYRWLGLDTSHTAVCLPHVEFGLSAAL